MNNIPVSICVTLSLAVVLSVPVCAATRKSNADFQGVSQLKTAIKLPATLSQLSVDVLNADLLLKHEKRDDLEIRVNYLNHWSVDDLGTVKQSAIARCTPGVYHTQNGTNLIGMGTVPGENKIDISSDGIFINEKKMPVEKRVSKPGQTGVDMTEEGIFVNGHRLIPGSLDRSFDKEVDVIQIVCPEDFKGALNFKSLSSFPTKIDSWTGDATKVEAAGRVTVQFDRISGHCELEATNGAHLKVGRIDAPSFSAHSSVESEVSITNAASSEATLQSEGSGSIQVNEGSIDTCNATVKEKAQLTLGSPKANAEICLRCGTVKLNASGTSNTIITNSAIKFLSLITANGAKVNACSSIDHIEETNEAKGTFSYTDLDLVRATNPGAGDGAQSEPASK